MTQDREQIRHILRAQVGDLGAYDALLETVQRRLFAYLIGLVGDRHLAEDVLQDVFVIVYRKLRWLKNPALFRPWLHRIATREAFRALRRAKRWHEVPIEGSAADSVAAPLPAEELEPELAAALRARIDAVSPSSRPVLLLHYIEGMSLEDVAGVLGLALGTVKSRLAYGLATLRKNMEPREGLAFGIEETT